MKASIFLPLMLSVGSAVADDEYVLFLNLISPADSIIEADSSEPVELKVDVLSEQGEAPDGGRVFCYSNRDGLLGETALDSEGLASLEVEIRSAGTHVLMLHAVDAQGRSGKRMLQAEVDTSPLPRAVVGSPRDGAQLEREDGELVFSAFIEVPDGSRVSGIWSSATAGPLTEGLSQDGPGFGPFDEDVTLEFSASLPAGHQLLVLRLWDERGRTLTYLQEIEVE